MSKGGNVRDSNHCIIKGGNILVWETYPRGRVNRIEGAASVFLVLYKRQDLLSRDRPDQVSHRSTRMLIETVDIRYRLDCNKRTGIKPYSSFASYRTLFEPFVLSF